MRTRNTRGTVSVVLLALVFMAGPVSEAIRRAESRDRHPSSFRRLWVVRINAAAREHGLTYGQFMAGLKAAGVTLDRKVLADIAMNDPAAFGVIAQKAKDSLLKQAA